MYGVGVDVRSVGSTTAYEAYGRGTFTRTDKTVQEAMPTPMAR